MTRKSTQKRTMSDVISDIVGSATVSSHMIIPDLEHKALAELFGLLPAGARDLLSRDDLPAVVLEFTSQRRTKIDSDYFGPLSEAPLSEDDRRSLESDLVAHFLSLPVPMRMEVQIATHVPVPVGGINLAESIAVRPVQPAPKKREEVAGSLAQLLIPKLATPEFVAELSFKFDGIPSRFRSTHTIAKAIDALKSFIGIGLVHGFVRRLDLPLKASETAVDFVLRNASGSKISYFDDAPDNEFGRFLQLTYLAPLPATLLGGVPDFFEVTGGWVRQILENDSQDAALLRAACQCLVEGEACADMSRRLLHWCFGLEVLLSESSASGDSGDDGAEGGGIGGTKLMADRCAYYLADTIEERKGVRKRFRDVYRLRSKLAHGVVRRLRPEESSTSVDARHILEALIRKVSLRFRGGNFKLAAV